MVKINKARRVDGKHSYITVEFDPVLDFPTGSINNVPSSDWYNADFPRAVNGVSMPLNITGDMGAGGMQNISSVYIDNSVGTGALSICNRDSGQSITCPGGYQGWFSIVAPSQSGAFDVSYVDKANPNAAFRPSWTTSARLGSITDYTGKQVNIPAQYNLTIIFTDRVTMPSMWRTYSGSTTVVRLAGLANVTLPQISQNNVRRFGVYLRNDDPALSVDIYIGPSAPASNAILRLAPGGVFSVMGDFAPSGAIFLYCLAGSAPVSGFELV